MKNIHTVPTDKPKKYKIIVVRDKNQSLGKALIDSMKSFSQTEGGLKKGEINLPNYKTIISKEKPKQRLEKYSERFDNKDNEIVEGIFNPETWGKRIVCKDCNKSLETCTCIEDTIDIKQV